MKALVAERARDRIAAESGEMASSLPTEVSGDMTTIITKQLRRKVAKNRKW